MAYYALLDDKNIVIGVISGVNENEVQIDADGTHVGGSSEAWEAFYASRSWLNAHDCKRTSFNHRIRKQYAGIGFRYDPVADVFIAPQPYPSWTLDQNHDWQPPKVKPEGIFFWDEAKGDWISVTQS